MQALNELLQVSALNFSHGAGVMKRLLDRAGNVEITEDVLVAVIRSSHRDELMKLLLDGSRRVCLTEEVLEEAIRFLDLETLLSLLDRVKAIGITKGFLEAAARNDRFADEILKLLMDGEQDVEVTDQLVTYAVANKVTGVEVLWLLESWIGKIHVTHKIMETAASSGNRRIMEFLLDRVDDAIITEEVLTKTVSQPTFRRPYETLGLKKEKARDLRITDKLLGLAVVYSFRDDDTFALLWSRSGKSIITNDLIQVAVGNGADLETLAFLLDQTREVEIEERVILKIMHRSERKKMLDLCLSRGIKIVITEKVLMAAAELECEFPVLGFLLQQSNGANVTEDVFNAAALDGFEKTIQELSPYCSIAKTPVTSLSIARLRRLVCNRNTAVAEVKEILGQGVNPDTPDTRGVTFLFDAAIFGNEPVVQTLLSMSANPNHQDIRGIVPLMGPASIGHSEVVKTLLSYGANPNLRGYRGKTPLFWATANGQYAVVEMLLDRGAICHVQDVDGDTPASVAKENGHIGMWRLLNQRSI